MMPSMGEERRGSTEAFVVYFRRLHGARRANGGVEVVAVEPLAICKTLRSVLVHLMLDLLALEFASLLSVFGRQRRYTVKLVSMLVLPARGVITASGDANVFHFFVDRNRPPPYTRTRQHLAIAALCRHVGKPDALPWKMA